MWSFDKTVALDASRRFYYKHVVKAAVTGEREVTFTFDQKGNRELPHIVGQLIVLPKHWWEGKDANGNQRDIAARTRAAARLPAPTALSETRPGRDLRARARFLGRQSQRQDDTTSTRSASSTYRT